MLFYYEISFRQVSIHSFIHSGQYCIIPGFNNWGCLLEFNVQIFSILTEIIMLTWCDLIINIECFRICLIAKLERPNKNVLPEFNYYHFWVRASMLALAQLGYSQFINIAGSKPGCQHQPLQSWTGIYMEELIINGDFREESEGC